MRSRAASSFVRRLALLVALGAPLVRGAVLKGPYVLLENSAALSIRIELDRPEASVVLWRDTAAGRTEERRLPDFARTPRDTFVARVAVDLRHEEKFRGYEIWHDDKLIGRYEWRSRIDGTLSEEPRLLVFGDTQGGKQTTARLAARWKGEEFDALVGLGDLVDAGSRYESWAEEFFGPLQDVLPHWPLLVVVGNHDPYRERSMVWFDAFFARADARRYFAIDFGDLRFIGLNNSDAHTKYGIDPIDPLTPQHAFLTRALLSRDALQRRHVVFAHVPLFSASTVVNREFGSELQRRYVWPLLERARVLGFFAGHHHKYERVLRRGMRGETQFMVTGGGGGHLFTKDRESGGTKMDREIFETYHYLLVDFRGAGSIVARSIDGAEIDRTTFGAASSSPAPARLALHRATLEADLSLVAGERLTGALSLRPSSAARPGPELTPAAELYRSPAGLFAVARDLPGAVTWQGYDAARRAWGYLQGAILVPATDDFRRACAIVSLNGADAAPFDRIFPVLHWPVAGSRAGVTEKSGAVVLLREAASFDLEPSRERVLTRWRWGEVAGMPLEPEQAARQLGVIEGAGVPRTLEGAASTALLGLLRDEPRNVFVVQAESGGVVAALVHWPRWRFLAVAPGAGLAKGHGAIFFPIESDTEINPAREIAGDGLWLRSDGQPEIFLPLAPRDR